ncbi:MAG TPA: hypothetical protein DCS29_00515 [Candidatus Magasanikbacteria bacterium]|nr:hypothetical protein [Candidatus Magasanikbacteria bacterium]
MSALALALKKAGYEVTGSDVGIYPPISTYLKDNGINYYTGWHPERMNNPDLVVVGNVAGSTNPEWLYVQKNNIPYKSYPEVIAEFFVKENSIVCAGTYGKSTSTAILTWILKENNFDPSYMFGGISLNDIPAAELTDSTYSILEGDEYKSARWDNGPKFAHYSPTHLLLTSVVWDHADVYPTEQSYINAFTNLLKQIPKEGIVILSAKVTHDLPELSKLSQAKTITYGKIEDNDYQYKNVITTKDGTSFDIIYHPKNNTLKPITYNLNTAYNVTTSSLGDYMADNMTGCFALAHQIDIDPEKIIHALATFKNIKRRLEKRYNNGVTIFDDIAHSPKKAEAVLRSLKKIYAGKIIAVFEPNSGNRLSEAIPGYDNKFIDADEVIIPRLTTIKKDPNKPQPLEGDELRDIIAQTHNNVNYIDNDEQLMKHLMNSSKNGDVIIFLGSHGFRGMIEKLTKSLQSPQG